MHPNTLQHPSQPFSSRVSNNLSRPAERVLRRGVARRAGKKFAVPGGNEAMTNEISRW